MIHLKTLLVEQKPIPVFKQGASDPNAITGSFNAKRIAKQIYDAKGILSDDEEKVLPAIKAIKNISQYNQVNKELQKLTSGRGIGEYLRSFLDINPRIIIASQLLTFIKKDQWQWTIKKIVPWADFKLIASGNYSVYEKWKLGTATGGEEKAILKLMAGPYRSAWNWWSNLSASDRWESWWKENGHTILITSQIVTAFIPVIGWAASAGIGLVNAKMYYDEGDQKSAGLEAIFSILPGISQIPGIKWLGKEGMTILGRKVVGASAKSTGIAFSKIELEVLEAMAKNDKAIKQQIAIYLKNGIVKNAKQIIASNIKQSTKQKLFAFAKSASFSVAGVVAYDYAYDLATMATPEQIQQQLFANLEQMYDQEIKNRK